MSRWKIVCLSVDLLEILTGRTLRSADVNIRFMFKSGRKRRMLLSLPRYAFIPSKIYRREGSIDGDGSRHLLL